MLQWLDTLIGLVVIILSVSLIIMILNQIIVALLNLRGRNLKKSIILLLENSEAELKEHADKISQEALSHPLVTDKKAKSGYMSLATTIRPKELLAILGVLSGTGEEEWQKKLKQYLPKITDSVENWFDNIMDRAAQSFVGQTRIWTVVFALILAFALHLDAFRLFEQISSDAELRASLVASSSAILDHAESVTGSSQDVTAVYTRSIIQLKESEPAAEALPPPPAINSRKEGAEWILLHIDDKELGDKLISRYYELIDAGLSSSLNQLSDRALSIKDDLEKTKLVLIPDPYPGLSYSLGSKHFWGVLVMAAFLSMGAPFWFRALKTMSSLRPILAEKEEKEKKPN